jgi:hypothetical protein
MLAALAFAAALNCETIQGAEALWARPDLRIVLVGEVHGTGETPAVVGSILCASRRIGAPAALALEAAPKDGQAEIDAYLASAGSEADRAALRRAAMWADPHARGSEAVLELVETARRLKARVVLFDVARPRLGPTDGEREQGMAGALAQAAAGGRVVALTGLGHADRTGFTSLKVASAIMRLPATSTVALAPIVSGGEAWGCRGTPPECKGQALPVRRPVSSRAIVLDPGVREGFDGGYSVGAPFTASPPAVRRD